MQTSGTVLCDQCQKAYRWKPELAGKRAKCKCGGRVAFPAQDPTTATIDSTEYTPAPSLADLGLPPDPVAAPPARTGAPAPRPAPRGQLTNTCAACSAPLAAGAVLCVKCGYNTRSGKRIQTKTSKESAGLQAAKGFGVKVGIAGGILAVVIGGVFILVTAIPQVAILGCLAIAILGILVSQIGFLWAVWRATADNILLRIACIFIGLICIIVVISRCLNDWESVKTPVLLALFGIMISVAGFVGMFLVTAHPG